jgi:imidazolonepropionase-like amidohydrolase
VRCFEHAYELDDATAALLASSGAFLTPTLVVTNSEPWMRANSFDQATIDNAARAAEGHRASIARAVAAGIPLLAGTDLPPAGDVGGVPATVRELQLLEEVGCSRLRALQAVSVNPARLLGCSGWLGQVRPRFRADLLVLEANPLDDLAAMASVRTVIQDGRVVAGAGQ